MKRLVDFFGSTAGLILLSPIIAVDAVLIWRQMGAPVLFRQTRLGLHGKPFQMIKFRTMRDALDAKGKPLPDSERITRLGGLMNYFSRFDFQRTIPNKVVDYPAAGPPIITGVKGELTNLAGGSDAVVPDTVADPASMAAALEHGHAHAAPGHRVPGPSRRLFEDNFKARNVMQAFTGFIEELAKGDAR